MLLDVVSVYNKVTDLTDRKQSVKISIDEVQVCFASTLTFCILVNHEETVLPKIRLLVVSRTKLAGSNSYFTTFF